MRHLHTDSHLGIAIAVLQVSDGYVDALLGLAREQIMARQPLIASKPTRTDRELGSRSGLFASRTKLHDGRVQSVAFSPDGARIVSGGGDGAVRLWTLDGKAAAPSQRIIDACRASKPDSTIARAMAEIEAG
jgi:hypothetical protein